MITRLSKILFILFLLLFSSVAQAYYNPGQPTGFVNDHTDTLSIEQKQLLENKLLTFEKETGNEISIVIINNLENDTIENFAEKLFKSWGIGKKGEDNGVLILVAKENREMRIEVGYGLEGSLTDAQSNWIINKIMKPAFQNNDFFKGLNETSDEIILATKGKIIPEQDNDNKQKTGLDYEFLFWVGIFGFFWITSILARSKSWWLGGVFGTIIGIIVGFIKGFVYFGILSIAILLPVGLLFDFVISKQYKKGKSRGHVPWWTGGGGRRGGGFGGFGGGMSGGGGSSGRW
ncbi:MAG: TPM domain-containing protein [Patescibacteria group bacterium]